MSHEKRTQSVVELFISQAGIIKLESVNRVQFAVEVAWTKPAAAIEVKLIEQGHSVQMQGPKGQQLCVELHTVDSWMPLANEHLTPGLPKLPSSCNPVASSRRIHEPGKRGRKRIPNIEVKRRIHESHSPLAQQLAHF